MWQYNGLKLTIMNGMMRVALLTALHRLRDRQAVTSIQRGCEQEAVRTSLRKSFEDSS